MIKNNVRVLYIDIAKAIAILLMVLLHSNYTYPGFNSAVGTFHMAVFFLIGGVFAKGEDTSIREVIKKSFCQLIIPYYIFSLIALTYGWIFPYLHPDLYHTDGSCGDIFKKAIVGILLMRDRVTHYAFQPCAALWFLSSLFWCRILFSVWIHSNYKRFYLEKVVVVIFLYCCYCFNISLFALNSTAICFPYFVLGYYLNRYLKRPSSINIRYLILLSIICFAAVFSLRGNGVMPDDAEIHGLLPLAYLRGIMGIVGVLTCAMILERLHFRPIVQYFKYVGEATLTIVGLHIAGIIAFKVVYVSMGFPKDKIPMTLAIVVSFVIAYLCAVIHHKYLKIKCPWIIGRKELQKMDPKK